MENAYLSKAVGKPLTICLAELTDKMPQDPIEWIAHWLYKYADNEIYFYEKSLLLKEMHKMRLELERERELRQKRLNKLNAQIAGMRHEVGEARRSFSQLLADAARAKGRKGDGKSGDGTLGERSKSTLGDRSRSTLGKRSRSRFGEGLRSGEGSRFGDRSRFGDGSRFRDGSRFGEGTGKDRRAGQDGWPSSPGKGGRWPKDGGTSSNDGDSPYRPEVPDHLVGTSTWSLDCQLGLICHHTVLGDMRRRPPFICPETPEWWERRRFLKQLLYDHEIYSRDNDDPYPGWDQVEHLTYKDFVEMGPWLQEKALVGMQPSLQDMYRMPPFDDEAP